MIEAIIEGVAARIHDEFGPGYEIYSGQIKQGLAPPCFLVTCVSSAATLEVGRRSYHRNLFSVKYFAASKVDARSECDAVCVRLLRQLETIKLESGPLRGTERNAQYIDDALVVTVNYNHYSIAPADESDPMAELAQTVGTKG